jgi:hypothetical protein
MSKLLPAQAGGWTQMARQPAEMQQKMQQKCCKARCQANIQTILNDSKLKSFLTQEFKLRCPNFRPSLACILRTFDILAQAVANHDLNDSLPRFRTIDEDN